MSNNNEVINDFDDNLETVLQDNMEIDDDLDRCSICLDFQNCDSIPMECCNKLIHSYCLNEWLICKNNCPLCRTQQSSYYNELASPREEFELSNNRFADAVSDMMDNLISESAQRVRRDENIGVSISRDIAFDSEREPLLGSSILPQPLFRRRRPLYNPLFSDFNRRSIFNFEEPVYNNMVFDIPRINVPLGITHIDYDEDIDLNFDIGVTNHNIGVTNHNIGVSIIREHMNNMREIDDIMMASSMDDYRDMINNMEIEENDEMIGISYHNENLGITNMRIETDNENNVHINLNGGNININFNMNDPFSSLNQLLSNVREEVMRLNRNLSHLEELNNNNRNE